MSKYPPLQDRQQAAELLIAMNKIAWAINDEDAMELWLVEGFEQDATDEEIRAAAADMNDEEIQDMFTAFAICAKRATADGCKLAFWA